MEMPLDKSELSPQRKNSPNDSLPSPTKHTSFLDIKNSLHKEVDGSPTFYDGTLTLRDSYKSIPIEIQVSQCQEETQGTFMIMVLRDTSQRDIIATRSSNNRFTDNLVSSLSHEFKTPLNGALNFLDLAIADSRIPPEPKEECLIPAKNSAELLSFMIYDAIDFSLISARELNIQYELANLNEILEKCVQLIQMQAKKKGLMILYEFDPSLPKKCRTDPQRLMQIVLNLLSNAVKFTFNGTIKLLAEREENLIKISVIDTGIGMSGSEQKKLKLALKNLRDGDKLNINSAGAGLGLKIAQVLASVLGPNSNKNGIVFESSDKGSTFSFFIESKRLKKESVCYLDSPHISQYPDSETRPIKSHVSNFIANQMPLLTEDNNSEINMSIELDIHDDSAVDNVPDDLLLSHTFSITKSMRQKNASSSSTLNTSPTLRPSQQQYSPTLFARRAASHPRTMIDLEVINEEDPKQHEREILIVDDDAFNILSLENMLMKFGKKCDTAFNGKDAIEKLRNKKSESRNDDEGFYRIIFMDYNMPVMNGCETSMEIRRMIANNDIPNVYIIGCTAHADVQDECIQAGMDECLQKPLKKEQVKSLLDKYSIRYYMRTHQNRMRLLSHDST